MSLLLRRGVRANERRLLQRPAIDAATVLGAACGSLLLRLFFVSVFPLSAVVGGGPFFATVAAPRAVNYLSVNYLSVNIVTLTTAGYGDLAARGDGGRMLARWRWGWPCSASCTW